MAVTKSPPMMPVNLIPGPARTARLTPPAPIGIIAPFLIYRSFAMEAERLNALKNSIQDLSSRTVELRRYL